MIGKTNAIVLTNINQLNAPTNLLITGSKLSWDSVAYAEGYIVYANNVLFTTLYIGSGVPSNSDGSNGDFYYDTSGGNTYYKSSGSWSLYQSGTTSHEVWLSSLSVGTYKMEVMAFAEGFMNSVKSDSVNYIYGKLLKPTGLGRSGNDLVWNSVPNATSYTIYCSTTSQTWTTSSTSKDMSSIFTNTGTYYVSVKATASGYADSDYSLDYGWQGGTSTFTVTFRRADTNDGSGSQVSIIPSGQSASILYYDDSVSYQLSSSTTFTIRFEVTGNNDPMLAYIDNSLVATITNQSYSTTRTYSSGETVDISYVMECLSQILKY